MLEQEKFSSTTMGRRRNSPSDRRFCNVPRSKHSTGRRNPRKSRRSHPSVPRKPSLNSCKPYKFVRRLSFTIIGMRSEESSVRSFYKRRRKRSKRSPLPRKCGERRCHHQRLHPAPTKDLNVWRVLLQTQNPISRVEVQGRYPFVHWHIG